MAFDPDEYLRGSGPTPSVTVEPGPTAVAPTETKAAPVSGFDPDAYLKSVGVAPAPTQEAPAPSGFDPDKYLAGIPSVGEQPKSTGILGQAKDYIKDQADLLGADLKIGAINTGIALDNLKLAGLMELQESRIAKYGNNLDAMPEDVRKDHIETGKAIERMLGSVAASAAKIKEVEQKTGVRETTKAFNDIRQTPEYKEAPFLTKAQMVGEKFLQDPVGIVTDLGLQSLPQSLGVAATAVAARVGMLSPTAAATAGGATSAMMEFGNQYAALREEGMGHKEAWEKAGVKSGVIGMFDAASFKLAGSAAEDVMSNISKGAFKETAKIVGKETAKQAGLGAAGEAAGSVAIGQPIDPGEVLAEAAGEIFGAPGEAVSTYRTERARGIIPETRIPEPPEARVSPTPAAPVAPAAPTVVAPSTYQDEKALAADLASIKTAPIELPPVAKAATTVAPAATPKAPEVFENIARPQTQTPQFQQWFGESKVKDETGKPKVMYHGTLGDVDEFRPKRKGRGIFVTEDLPTAERFATDFAGREGAQPNIVPVYVRAENPFDYENPEHLQRVLDQMDDLSFATPGDKRLTENYAKLGDWETIEKTNFQNAIKDAGFDSFYVQEGGVKNLAVFDPNQVKSAIGNKGTFSKESNKIVENVGPRYIAPSAFASQLERSPSFRTEMKRLSKMVKDGRISPEIMSRQTEVLLEQTKKEKQFKPRLRGQNIIREKLSAAARRGELSQEGVDLANWLISKNPNLVEDLAISIRKPGETTPSGRYDVLNRLVTLFKESNASDTAIHEILHHLERMMPADVQAALRKLWYKRFLQAAKAADKGTDENLKKYLQNVLDYHINDDRNAGNEAKRMLSNGDVDIQNYQYFSPSEFWAVNASDLVAGRYEGDKSFLGKLKQWLKELGSKIKSIFGLTSDAPIIRALDSLYKSDGKFVSSDMLMPTLTVENVEPPKKVKINRKNYKGDPAPLATWAQEPESKFISDTFIYRAQDPLIDVKRFVQAIKNQVGEISAKWDPYKREILYHGRAADAVKKFLRFDVQALIESIGKLGLTMPEVKEYLHNRHAPERNASVAKINPTMPDGGSGIMTADAEAYMNGLSKEKRKKLEEIAKTVDDIVRKTQKILVDTGQYTQDVIDNWNKAYKYYVPLFREDLDYVETGAKGTGQGFSVRGGFTKRAMGSDKPVEDILTNIILGYERAVGRGEKNLVLQSLYGLAVQNPNSDIWLPINPDAPSSTKQAKEELLRMGISPTDVDNLMREPMESYIDPKTGLVGQRLKQSIRDSNYALPLRIEGKQRFLIFNPNNEQANRAALALKNMDMRDIHAAFSLFSMFTRWYSSVNTQYNPIFGLLNLYRDVQGAALNLSSTPLAGKQKEIMIQSIKNLPGVYQALRAETKGQVIDTDIGRDFADMQAHGGQTGYRDSYQQKREQHKIIEDTLARMEAGPAKKGLMYTLELLSDVNDTMENAVRLAIYQTSLKYANKKDSNAKDNAGVLAKTTTVNFNKRGAWVQEANALYAFFNPSIQGTARIVETLSQRQKNGKYILSSAGKKIILGGLSVGVIQALALAMAGFDDEQPPPFVRDKNLIIPIPGTDKKYYSHPMPLGFSALPNIGRIITEIMLQGGKDAEKKLAHLFVAVLDSFNPFGGSESFAQLISPTFADPIIALAENKDAFGRPIYKKDRDTSPSPGHTRAKDTASSFSKEMSRFLNLISGGSEDRKGAFSPTPDQIDYVIGQLTGGVGRELMKIDQSLRSLGSGEELPPYKIPILGRFYGDAASQAAQAGTFYENVTALSQFEREIKGRIERKEGAESVYREHPEARLWRKANRVENDISDLNKRKRELIAKDAPASEIKRIEERKKMIMQSFNKEYESAKK